MDAADGEYGFGKALPDAACKNIVYYPSDVQWVVDVVEHMRLDAGWAEDAVEGYVDLDAAAALIDDRPGYMQWGMVFDTDPDDRDAFPTDVNVHFYYNSTMLEPINMYFTDDVLATAFRGGATLWSASVVSLQALTERALLAVGADITYRPVLRAYPGFFAEDLAPSLMVTQTIVVLVVVLQLVMVANDIASEKEAGRLQALRLMGASDAIYWLSWWVFEILVYALSICPMMYCLYCMPRDNDIFPYVDHRVMWLFFGLGGAVSTGLGTFIASLCMTAKSAIMYGFLAVSLVFVTSLILTDINETTTILYDPTVFNSVARITTSLIYPYLPFVAAFKQVFTVATPVAGVDTETYETVLTAPDYDFTWDLLFDDPVISCSGSEDDVVSATDECHVYVEDDIDCINNATDTCTYSNQTLDVYMRHICISAVMYSLAAWVVGESLMTAGSVGRNPLQLLMPA
ncbi:ABC transporter A, ABCA, partial [Kipferlia bialata]|eukprot:g9333.t1